MKSAMSPYTAYAIYGAAGFQFAIAVVAGLIFGGYLDGKLGTSPWIMVTGLVLGFIGGLVNIFKIMKRYERSKNSGTGPYDTQFKR